MPNTEIFRKGFISTHLKFFGFTFFVKKVMNLFPKISGSLHRHIADQWHYRHIQVGAVGEHPTQNNTLFRTQVLFSWELGYHAPLGNHSADCPTISDKFDVHCFGDSYSLCGSR